MKRSVGNNATDVLAAIDLERDGVKGSWRMSDGVLISPIRPVGSGSPEEAAKARPFIMFPVEVPEEYTISMSVERDKPEGINLLLPVDGRQVVLSIDGYPQEGGKSGQTEVDGESILKSDITISGMHLRSGPNEIEARVIQGDRKGLLEISAVCNGETIFHWLGDSKRLSCHPMWKHLPRKDRIYLATVPEELRFSKIVLQDESTKATEAE